MQWLHKNDSKPQGIIYILPSAQGNVTYITLPVPLKFSARLVQSSISSVRSLGQLWWIKSVIAV